MSASQTPSPGPVASGGSNRTLPPRPRKRPAADPLVRKKKPPQPRPAQPNTSASLRNGALSSRSNGPQVLQNRHDLLHAPSTTLSLQDEEYEDIPLYTTKRTALDGYRYHIMRFLPNLSSAVRSVDPANEDQFTRPVRLHRRDPRANANSTFREDSVESGNAEEKPDDKDRQRLEAVKAERRAEREANQAQIAPAVKSQPAKRQGNKRKTEQVYDTRDEGKKKNQQIRYEESLPWHLEDFDNQTTWSGSYEAALSDCHMMLVRSEGPNGTFFNILPLEKWYKFTAKNQFKTFTIEEAEAQLGKRFKDPRWLQRQKGEALAEKQARVQQEKASKLFTRRGERGERAATGGEDDEDRPEVSKDIDDIDYDYDEAFADDEENPLFEGDERDKAEAEERIKRERHEAAVFDIKEEKDFDAEEEEEKRKEEERKKLAKRVQKALLRQEKNFAYDEDEEGNPYLTESESEDSEEERLREEERQKDEEKRVGADKVKGSGDKPSSSTSTKGTNTPQPRTSKPTDPKKSLKRPSSPNLSETSGNESSRKKPKNRHLSSAQSTDVSVARGVSVSRPSSPSNDSTLGRKASALKIKMGSSSAADHISDSRRTAGGVASDGEMSDGAGRKRHQSSGNHSPHSTSPGGSRAASPSPGVTGAVARRPSTVPAGAPHSMPTPEEILEKIPPEGLHMNQLMTLFKANVKDKAFIPLLKAHTRWDKESKMIFRK